MDLSKRVASSPNACMVSLFFSGNPKPSTIINTDAFYASVLSKDDKANLYVSSGSVKVAEKSTNSRPGLHFTQTITFSLPTTDEFRAQRIHQFRKVKYLSIILSDKRQLFFGRNDIKQNTPPKISISSNEKLTQIQFQQKSIIPLGFLTEKVFTFQDGLQFLFQDGSSFQ